MSELTPEYIEKIAVLGVNIITVKAMFVELKESLGEVKKDVKSLDEKQTETTHGLKDLTDKVQEMSVKTAKNIDDLEAKTSSVSRFFKSNWYKIWLVAVTCIACLGPLGGVIVEYLHNLPPPVRH